MAQRVIDGFVLEEAVVLCPECQLPFTSEFLVESRKVNTSDIIEADLHRVFNDPELRSGMLACCPSCKFCGWNGMFKPFPLKPELLRKEAKIEPSKKFALAVKWAREKKVHSLDIAFIALNGLWCAREAGEVDSLWLELAIYEHEKGVAASPSCPQDDGMTHLIMGELYRQHRDFEKAEAEYALAEQDRTISREILEHVRMMNTRKFYGVIALPVRLARLYFEVEEAGIREENQTEFNPEAVAAAASSTEETTAPKAAGAADQAGSAGDAVPLLAAINSLFSAPTSELLSSYAAQETETDESTLNALSSELTKAADTVSAAPNSSQTDASAADIALQERAAAERAAVEKAALEKAAAEKAERAMLERAAARSAAEKAARLAAEKAAAEKAAAEKAAAEKAAAEKAALEKAAAEKAAAEKAAAEKAAAEKAAAEKAAAEKAAAEKAAAEKAAAEKAALEKAAAIKATLEKAAAERAAGIITKPEDQIPSLAVEPEPGKRASITPKIKAVIPKQNQSPAASKTAHEEPSTAPVQVSRSSVTIAPAASTVSLSVTTASRTASAEVQTAKAETPRQEENSHPTRKSKAKRVKSPREDHHFTRRPLVRNVAANANGWINDYGNSLQPAYAAASLREEKLEFQQRPVEQTQSQNQRSTGERLPAYSNQEAAASAADAPLPGLAIEDPVQGKDYSDAINRVESYLSFSRRVYSRNWMKL